MPAARSVPSGDQLTPPAPKGPAASLRRQPVGTLSAPAPEKVAAKPLRPAIADEREISPEQVIPLDDDFKDF